MFCAGGARCLSPMDVGIGGSSSSPWIVSGGKGGDVAVHDFRYIATKKAKRPRHVETEQIFSSSPTPQRGVGEVGRGGMLWSLPKAHSGQSSPHLGFYHFMCTRRSFRGVPNK